MARDLHQNAQDSTDEPPEPPRLRNLRRLVMLLTATMILAMLVIAVAVVYRVASPGGQSLAPPVSGEIPVADGFRVLSVSRTSDRIILLLQTPNGSRMIEERGNDGRQLIGQYRLVPLE